VNAGANQIPAEERCPTLEQMAGFKYGLDNGDICADPSIFGPYGNRTIKRMKMVGKVFNSDGSVSTVEFYGPANFYRYMDSMNVYEVLVIFFDVMDYGTYTLYKRKQEGYHMMFGHDCWALQYQT
jgi:hypothetical protein